MGGSPKLTTVRDHRDRAAVSSSRAEDVGPPEIARQPGSATGCVYHQPPLLSRTSVSGARAGKTYLVALHRRVMRAVLASASSRRARIPSKKGLFRGFDVKGWFPRSRAVTGEADSETLRSEYEEICKSHQAITDFRGKLLGLLPLAAGAGIFLLLDKSAKIEAPLLAAAGVFGALVTIGLYFYEHRGMKECILLRERGGKLECRLRLTEDYSRFQGNTAGFVGPQGAGPIVYFAVVGGWLFVSSYGFLKSRPGWEQVVGSLIFVAYLLAVCAVYLIFRFCTRSNDNYDGRQGRYAPDHQLVDQVHEANGRPRTTKSAAEPNGKGGLANGLERTKQLWEEYRYRHDLIWRLLFRITFVAVLLSIAPFTINDSVRQRVGFWIYSLPVLAFLLVLGGWLLLVKEFWLFQPIDNLYRYFRKRALEEQLPYPLTYDLRTISQKCKKRDIFRLIVFLYPAALLLLIVVTFGAFVWTGR